MKAETDVRIHNTDPALFDALERVFGAKTNEGTRWIDIPTTVDVKLVFFAVDSRTPAHHLEDVGS